MDSIQAAFDLFTTTCSTELVNEDNPIESITSQLNSLKTKYEKAYIWKNKVLEQILAHFDHSIKAEPDFTGKQLLFYDFKEEFKRLDKFLNTLKGKDKKERTKLMAKIKDLQTRIKKDLRKIDRLDQAEISLDDLDDENSPHMKKYIVEQRVKRLSNKLLRLQGAKESARLLDKAYKYTGTPYKELNEAISTKYRAIMQKKYKGKIPQRPINSTPSIADIEELIDQYCANKKTTILNKTELALQITDDVIHEVQKRRELELYEMMNDYEHDSHLRPELVPNLDDEELNKRLVDNEKICRDNFIKKKDELQKKLDGNAESADIGGADDSASEDDDDPMEDVNDDDDDDKDEEISEDEAIESGDDLKDETEDEDAILLDQPTNGSTVINDSEPSTSTEIKKRAAETNGSGTNEEGSSKKIKVTQVNEVSNSDDKRENLADVKMETKEEEEVLKEEEKEDKEKEKEKEKEDKEQEGQTEGLKEELKEKEEEKEDESEKDKKEGTEKVEEKKETLVEKMEEDQVKEESNVDQTPHIPVESKEETQSNEEENSAKSKIDESIDKPKSPATSTQSNQASSSTAESPIKTVTTAKPKINQSESDDSIKIVDLEAEGRSADDDDDDDVICLD